MPGTLYLHITQSKVFLRARRLCVADVAAVEIGQDEQHPDEWQDIEVVLHRSETVSKT